MAVPEAAASIRTVSPSSETARSLSIRWPKFMNTKSFKYGVYFLDRIELLRSTDNCSSVWEGSSRQDDNRPKERSAQFHGHCSEASLSRASPRMQKLDPRV
mmetsp:Transcript_43352/g.116028  ORF Transcript_43352/g.116028 Transcript_43352/m.116028 type:complete len:101 (-) Transcript_43352:2030-2332(-)